MDELINLLICTFNIKNIYSNWIYLDELIKRHKIIFLQELWITFDNDPISTDKYNKAGMNITMKANEDFIKRRNGRPFGGMGWITDKTINAKIILNSDRITTLELLETTEKILIIGVYLPSNGNIEDNLQEELAEIETIAYTYPNQEVLIIGDFNCDLLRLNKRDQLLERLIARLKMECHDMQALKYTYKGHGKSWIDHIICKQNTSLTVKNVEIVNEKSDQNTTLNI